MSYSVNQSARELLYIPVGPEAKYRAKIFIDMFLNRFSKAVGGHPARPLSPPVHRKIRGRRGPGPSGRRERRLRGVHRRLDGPLNARLDRSYLREVRLQLAKKWERPDTLVSERMDVETAKLIVDALESRTQSPTLFALNLYDLARRRKLTPEIKSLLVPPPAERLPAAPSPLLESGETPWTPDAEDPVLSEGMDAEIRDILALDSDQKLHQGNPHSCLHDPRTCRTGNEPAGDHREVLSRYYRRGYQSLSSLRR